MDVKGHGCQQVILLSSILFPAVGLAEGEQALPADTIFVNSRMMEVNYSVASETDVLRQVEVYITTDRGASWHKHDCGSSHTSPLRLEVSGDGLYGIFLVLRNDVGYSSGPPGPGQAPHRWVMVDGAVPLTQVKRVHLVEGDASTPARVIVSWAAYDNHLGDRPVSLYYQLRGRPGWHAMTTQLSGSVTRFDWVVPAHVDGELEIKLEVADRAGNIGTAISQPVKIAASDAVLHLTSATTVIGDPPGQRTPAEPAKPAAHLAMPSKQDVERAHKLYKLGGFYKERGEYSIAVERFLEALQHDATLTAPRYDLAEIYLAEGDYKGALDIYQTILDLRPDDRESLRGSALASVALKRYPEALQDLDRVLAAAPDDAQAWIDTGDVLMRMGNSAEAARHWREAKRLSAANSQIRSRAEVRLQKFAVKTP